MARRRQGGFTLIEVVVAFAILALSLGALYQSFGESLRRGGEARQAELATLRAESLLAEFRGSGGLLPKEHAGEDAELGHSWSITVKPYPAEVSASSTLEVDAVDVEVKWGSKRHGVQLHSVELLPKAPS